MKIQLLLDLLSFPRVILGYGIDAEQVIIVFAGLPVRAFHKCMEAFVLDLTSYLIATNAADLQGFVVLIFNVDSGLAIIGLHIFVVYFKHIS